MHSRQVMNVRKALVIIDDNGRHSVNEMDVIEHAGTFWLVPGWLDNVAHGITQPERMVPLKNLPHQRTTNRQEFVLHNPVPSFVFFGRIPPGMEERYAVVHSPDISFPISPRGLN